MFSSCIFIIKIRNYINYFQFIEKKRNYNFVYSYLGYKNFSKILVVCDNRVKLKKRKFKIWMKQDGLNSNEKSKKKDWKLND